MKSTAVCYRADRSISDRLVCRVDGGHLEYIESRQDLINHSPDGFNWGYGGSGPHQLGLALLCDFLENDQVAVERYRQFTMSVVANLPHQSWEITGDLILAAFAAIESRIPCPA